MSLATSLQVHDSQQSSQDQNNPSNFQRFEHINQLCQDLQATQQFYQTFFTATGF
jgi:hypothetical protein